MEFDECEPLRKCSTVPQCGAQWNYFIAEELTVPNSVFLV